MSKELDSELKKFKIQIRSKYRKTGFRWIPFGTLLSPNVLVFEWLFLDFVFIFKKPILWS